MLLLLLCASTAHARPSFELGTFSARAGDVVHFSISNVDGWGVAYHLELDGEDLLDGRFNSSATGTFTMPDLGAEPMTLNLSAWLWWSDSRTRVNRTLEYRGPALPPPPPAPAPATSAPAPAATPSPQDGHAPAPAGKAPSSAPKPKATAETRPRAHTAPGTNRRVAARAERRRGRTQRTRDDKRRRAARKHRGSAPPVRGAGPFLNGFEGPGAAGPGAGSGAAADDPDVTLASRSADGWNAAIVVPAVLTAVALALAGTAALRRRRLRA
jgi:hypothetical protein